MKIKILGLRDAFRLASILSKYVDITKFNPNQDAVDFISGIVDQISPQEYLTCVSMMTEKTEEDLTKEISLDILTAFVEGLKKNEVVYLLSFYKSIGF